MRRLRTLALAALLTSLSLGPTPASAQIAVLVFTGAADVACFGCGSSSPCHADLNILGITHSGPAATTSCTATRFGGLPCLLAGAAFGTAVGAGLTLNFNWTRVGAVAVITTSGDVAGFGTAAFFAPGISCGAPLNDAIIVGSVVGV